MATAVWSSGRSRKAPSSRKKPETKPMTPRYVAIIERVIVASAKKIAE